MSITMWDVFRDPLFRRCDPLIAAGSGGMGNEVRWAYTHERFDVTDFLSGGEFLIIEGSVLYGLDEARWREYIDSLADVGVSGLAMELIDYFAEVPQALASHADERNLPVIGMRSRIPFVNLCQEINTRIVREQILSQMEMDKLSTSLRKGMAEADTVQDAAAVLNRVTGEAVVIFDSTGSLVARAGLDDVHDQAWPDCRFVALPVRCRGIVVATVGISQRFSIVDAKMRESIAAILGRCLPPFLTRSVEEQIRGRLLRGASDGLYATGQECEDCGSALSVLGFSKHSRVFVFAIVFERLEARIPRMAELLRTVLDGDDRIGVLYALEGNVIYGCFLSDDGVVRVDEFNETCRTALTAFVSVNMWIVAGVGGLGAASLLNGFAAIRYVVGGREPNWGHITPLHDDAIERMLSIADTDAAVDVFIGQIAGARLPEDDTLVATLCAVADYAGSKTEACSRLGVTRQTLYNRLDKVTELTGIEQRDSKAWSLLLFASCLIRARRGRS